MTERQLIASSVYATESAVAKLCYELAQLAYPQGAPWRLATFAADLAMPQSLYQLLVVRGQPIGFISLTIVLDEVEITNVAIVPAYQGQGHATFMLQTVLRQLPIASQVFLEVRDSNHTAQRLYARCGFSKLSTRKAYYQQPREDALIMRKIIN
ncbi:ribosomal-protein-alanine N-acetyltransferase [Lactobacillus sp. CBA3605]|uniref:ribosomal protein S18-alanine N-acetyltransferase n=1 Tax=Lactobacillus sp. CBA3605 TaxID=2099788 RepID=UPI000CFD87B3|nr:ribosomal protein S18-alanine N-acetyltransferase [Lactobacillus sp. CBA3605]AVK61931.1 ribosomal-protein-alanine N-acetyltransferase [Lactobacillus sp. CBA3605]